MSHPQQRQTGPGDNDLNALIIIAIFAGIAWLIWHFFKEYFIAGYLYVKYAQIWLLSMVSGDEVIAGMKSFLEKNELGKVPPTTARQVGQILGSITKFFYIAVFGVITVVLAVKLYRRDNVMFPSKFTLESLMQYQSQAFHAPLPVLRDNPADDKYLKRGSAWEPPNNPEEFARYQNLLQGNKFRLGAAQKVFAAQLSRKLSAYRFKPHDELLVACFLFLAGREREKARKLLRIAGLAYYNHGSMAKAAKTIRRKADKLISEAHLKHGEHWKQIKTRHAYFETAMMALLQLARDKAGVMPTGEFIWLRPTDRVLYYALNNLGRYTHFCEAAGIWAHWDAEVRADRPILAPQVNGAAAALHVKLIRGGLVDGKAKPIMDAEPKQIDQQDSVGVANG